MPLLPAVVAALSKDGPDPWDARAGRTKLAAATRRTPIVRELLMYTNHRVIVDPSARAGGSRSHGR